MQDNGFFTWLGERLGDALRELVAFLNHLFGGAFSAAGDFVDGLTASLGISDSLFAMLMLVIGLLTLYKGLRGFLRGAVIGALIWTLLGLAILSWLIV
ncbi:hypothetical protein [Modicisalibacter sp. 'Wilcox']|uniref:hypothetical protein n=1 Tax=Modicisalibacter sp. 'Wilcox' TaxID=2679914 RepID=UPI0013D8D175|nr:hypothetical protein [Modicisalibacter sp. 'Wilcox']